MESFILYLLKSSGAICLFFGLYWLALRKGTYHSWNRVYLLLAIVVSVLFPLINFSAIVPASALGAVMLEPVKVSAFLQPGLTEAKTFPLQVIISIIYISGAVYFSFQFLSSLVKIHFLYQRYPRYNFNGFKAIVLDNEQSPFTFFNILFISRNDFESGRIAEVMEHERAHKDQLHSFDALLLEMVTIFQWFNPVIWLFKRALKSEHEYYADKAVLNKGYSRVMYQKLLFEKSLGTATIDLTNSFNYLLLKNRLKMMTIQKTSKLMKIKYLISIPAIFLLLFFVLINCSKNDQLLIETPTDEELFIIVEEMPVYRDGGEEGFRKAIRENLVYTKSLVEGKITGKVYVKFIVDSKGKIHDVRCVKTVAESELNASAQISENDKWFKAEMEAQAIRTVNNLGDFVPGKQRGKNVAVELTVPIVFEYFNAF